MSFKIPENIKEVAIKLAMQPYFWGSLLALLTIIYFWRKYTRSKRPIRITGGDTGVIQVSPNALLDLVHHACNKDAGVSRLRIKYKVKSGKLNLKVLLKIDAEKRIVPLSTELQNHLVSILKDNLGIDALGKVDILITGFSKKIRTSYNPEKDNRSETFDSFPGTDDND